MNNQSVILSLPKDLGDCLLCIPAIKRLQSYCHEQKLDLVAIGGKRQLEWVETLGGIKLDWREAKDVAGNTAPARFLFNCNFYDNAQIDQFFCRCAAVSAGKTGCS